MPWRDMGSLLFLSSDIPPAGPRKRYGLKRTTGLKRATEREAICQSCGATFISRPTHLGRTKFCSRQCFGDSWRKPVERICDFCGEAFVTVPSRAATIKSCGKPACVSQAKSRALRGVKRSPEMAEKVRQTNLARGRRREAGLPIPKRGVCARPGCQNPLTGQAMKYCSPRCHYDDRGRHGVSKQSQAYHRCATCGEVFAWNGRGRGVFCSRSCKDQRGGCKPREPEVVEVVRIRGHRRHEFKDNTESCRSCGAPAQHTHHAVYRQHIERLKGDRWHPDDALALCVHCHGQAHAHRLPVSVLRGENLAFAVDLLGAYAVDYLRRYYHDDGDPRLVALESVREAA